MSVRTLVGEYDGTKAAVMVDSANGTAFGPVFEGAESGEQVEAFQAWLRLLPFTFEGVADEIGFDIGDLPTGGDGDDPRDWPESGLTKLVAYWRENFLDEIGYLKDDVSDG